MVTDTAAQRFSGAPELGQMLATVTTDIITGPWKMFAAGSMVFLTVLGFNLLGAGLRQQLAVEQARRRTWSARLRERVGEWIEEKALMPLSMPTRARVSRALGAVVLVAAALVAAFWWRGQFANSEAASAPVLPVPGGHLWASERHDPYGTLSTDAEGPLTRNPKIVWALYDPGGLSGGPAVSAEKIVYVAAKGSSASYREVYVVAGSVNVKGPMLYALEPSGQLVWKAPLPAQPVGAPALCSEGSLYVADEEGGLSAINPQGELLWRFEQPEPREATSGPIVGADGAIYYAMSGDVQAVSAEGQPLWRAAAFPRRLVSAPRLSPDGKLVFLKNTALHVDDGSRAEFKSLPVVEQFIVGGNGRTYFRFEDYVADWRPLDGDAEVFPMVRWNRRGYGFLGFPPDTGVTRDGLFWLLYGGDQEDGRIAWVDMQGNVAGVAGFPYRPSRVIAIGRDSITYACGLRRGIGPECRAFRPGTDEPVWQLPLGGEGMVNGGALVPGVLYVTTESGYLGAIGDVTPR